MSKTYTTLSREGYTYLIGLIRNLANVSEGIDDLHLLSNGTFSSVKINTLLNTLKSDCTQYTDTLVANLTRLELKLVTNESDISQPNIMYLYKPDGATSYNQYVVIDGTKVLLGTCDVEMSDYLKVSDAANKYTLKTDYDTLVNEVTDIKDKIGTETMDVKATTIKGAINELANKAGVVDLTQSITPTSTETDIPSGKAVFDAIHAPISITITSATDVTTLLNTLKTIQPGTCASIKIYDGSAVLFPVAGNYIGTVSVINGNEITAICVNHWYAQYAYTFRVQGEDTSISVNKICTTKVADVPWTVLTLEGDFTGTVKYCVKNGTCHVLVDTLTSTTVMASGNQLICKGIPKPDNNDINYWAIVANSNEPRDTLILTANYLGELRSHVGTNSAPYYGTFSYPVAES